MVAGSIELEKVVIIIAQEPRLVAELCVGI
jgi:hypothetical protein